MFKYFNFFIFLICAALLSCTVDAYEKGEGDYSLLTAELVEASVNSSKQVTQVITDDAQLLTLTQPFTAKWVARPDTTYRALLYYNRVGAAKAEVVNMGAVSVLYPLNADSLKKGMKADPLYVESIWQSRNGRYLNMQLRLLTGQVANDSIRQSIGIVKAKGSTSTHQQLQLYHDQGGQPEYYSSSVVVSLATNSLSADTVTITVNTYDGPFVRTLTGWKAASGDRG